MKMSFGPPLLGVMPKGRKWLNPLWSPDDSPAPASGSATVPAWWGYEEGQPLTDVERAARGMRAAQRRGDALPRTRKQQTKWNRPHARPSSGPRVQPSVCDERAKRLDLHRPRELPPTEEWPRNMIDRERPSPQLWQPSFDWRPTSSLPAKQPEFCLRPFSSPSPAVIAQAVQLQEWDDSRGEPAEKHRGGGLSWEVDWHSIQVPEPERRSEPTNPPQPNRDSWRTLRVPSAEVAPPPQPADFTPAAIPGGSLLDAIESFAHGPLGSHFMCDGAERGCLPAGADSVWEA